ncbi:MAG: hypothetical protein QOG79_6504 [Mycobacterium sp.]|jgi:hypothetical protein|nr:hypothetical protein [Mycobacterium sp.]
MTNPGGDAGQTPSPEAGTGAAEPHAGGYEAPPIEQSQQPSEFPPPPSDDTPSYEAPAYTPPAFDQGAYPPPVDPQFYPPPVDPQFYPPQGAGYPPPSHPPPPPYGAPPGYGPPPGYGAPPPPYGAPGFGPPPPYGAPGYGAPPPPAVYGAYGAQSAPTNNLAIASVVASVIGFFCFIGSIIGIVLGIVALNQVKATGANGRGLAIAGIAIGAGSLLISLIWIVAILGS